LYGVGSGDDLLARVIVDLWARYLVLGDGRVKCGIKSLKVLLDGWRVYVRDRVHVFFPLCEEGLRDRKVEFYGLRG
jgi:hypothetical protein